jgi:MFS family permease
MGTFWGFITTAMPFLLRKQGIPVDQIASISALTGIAQIVYVLWSPLADMLLTRRAWVLLLSFLSAMMLFVAVMLPLPKNLPLYAALLILGNAVNTSTSIASGGLMAVLIPGSSHGKAGGWYQAGNLGGGALAGGVCIWLAERVPVWGFATAAAAMVFVPSLAVLFVKEAPRDLTPSWALFTTMFHKFRDLMNQRSTWVGFLFFLSPLGAASAGTLFSGIGVDYNASAKIVMWVTGFGGALCTIIGSVAGGYLCDHMDRRNAYLLSGGLSAVASGAMLLAPISPVVFAVGASAYLMMAGFSYGAFNALALELTDGEPCTGGARFSLFSAAANGPVAYMTWLDGQGDRRWGVRGLLGVDTAGNVIGVIGMVLIMRLMSRWLSAAPGLEASPLPPIPS